MINKDFWDERYRSGDTGWDLGTVSPPLKAYIDQLTDKQLRILIPGAGNAHEAEYLHRKGFDQVTVVDISPLAIAQCKARVPDFPSEHLICSDFFDLKGSFDLMLEQTFFCALDPSLREAYAKKTSELLQPNGKIAGVMFDELRESGPPFGGTSAEYTALFSPYYTILQLAPCYNSVDSRAGREVFIRLRVR